MGRNRAQSDGQGSECGLGSEGSPRDKGGPLPDGGPLPHGGPLPRLAQLMQLFQRPPRLLPAQDRHSRVIAVERRSAPNCSVQCRSEPIYTALSQFIPLGADSYSLADLYPLVQRQGSAGWCAGMQRMDWRGEHSSMRAWRVSGHLPGASRFAAATQVAPAGRVVQQKQVHVAGPQIAQAALELRGPGSGCLARSGRSARGDELGAFGSGRSARGARLGVIGSGH